MADKAPITPKILAWARESARISVEDAAKKAGVKKERIVEWEKGESLPTIRQAKLLAEAYKRSFALFFLPEIPTDFQPLQDFRKPGSLSLSTGSLFIIREIQQKQAWISAVNEENEESRIPFVGRFKMSDGIDKVAKNMLETLGINPFAYERSNPILEWVEKAESKGVFVSRTSFIHSRLKLDSKELQGFAISDSYAPFVFVNSEDWNAPQLFTLVHELAHLWIAKSGISNEVHPEPKSNSKFHPVELFCNSVAASALMPKELFNSLPESAFSSGKSIFNEAKKFGVSSFAFLVRALNLGLISHNKYGSLKKEADKEFKVFLEREAIKKAKQKANPKGGGPDYYLLALNKNSRLFTQTVLDAYKSGSIEPTEASSLLNVKVNKFPKLEERLYR